MKAFIALALALALALILSPCVAYAQEPGTVVYLPIVSNGAGVPFGVYHSGAPGGRWEVDDACSDPTRGRLYRDMVDDTEDTLDPIGEYYADKCCTVEEAQAKGAYLGNALGLVRTILDRIFTVIWRLIVTVIDMVLALFGLSSAPAAGYAPLQCEADARYICFGLAAIVALDDLAGGWIMAMTVLVLSVITFYLVVYVVGEGREIIAGTGGEG